MFKHEKSRKTKIIVFKKMKDLTEIEKKSLRKGISKEYRREIKSMDKKSYSNA